MLWASLARSGAFLTAVYAAAQTALLECGREILSEMIETLSEIYGTPPIEALAWIRSTVNGELDLLTIQLGNEVDGLA